MIPSIQVQLEQNYLLSMLPKGIRDSVSGLIYFSGDVLIIRCADMENASVLRDFSYKNLLYVVATTDGLKLRTVRYEWNEADERGGEKLRAWSLPLYFTENSEKSMLALSKLDLSGIPELSDFEILQELHNYSTETGLPASCLSMIDSKPLFASDNITRSCGVGKGDFLRIGNTESYFPAIELATYKDRILAANGQEVDLPYIAANISDRQLCDRMVRARLVKTSWGEVVRLCKVLRLPIGLGRTI